MAKKFINGEISWLSFNNRVLQEVCNESTPLIERIRFLAIYSSNMDEFFRVRVAALTRYSKLNRLFQGEKPKKVLTEIHKQVKQQQVYVETIYYNELLPLLAKENIFIINNDQLNDMQGLFVRNYFKQQILQDISPIIIDGFEMNIQLKDPAIYFFINLSNTEDKKQRAHALMEIPSNHSRFLILPGEGEKKYIILLDDVIRYCLDDVFCMFGYNDFEAYTIKVTRDAELDFDTGLSVSLIDSISRSLKQRKKGVPVRFTYDKDMPPKSLNYIIKKLKIKTPNIIPGRRYHNFKDFMKFPNVNGSHLEYTPTPPVYRSDIHFHQSFFSAIAKKNYLISVPYESFDYILHFLREAAIDPDVVSIKMTLYRLADKSRIINALINAARNGKKVVAMVELKARFDEQSNIYWTQELEEAGVKVLHGIPMMKIHSKICLVTRRKKNEKEERFAMLGTGNYNENTAKVYGDYHYFTASKRITSELNSLFEKLEQGYLNGTFSTLLISPLNFRKKIISLIDKEIFNAKNKKEAYIRMKMNSLTDEDIILKLYEASKAGVQIQLIVRGMCRLIPQKEKLSENISVISIVDKFLEHARVYIFANGGKESIYLSSADIMIRNLDHRVEVTFPLLDAESKQIVKDMIDIQLKDNVKARIIDESLSNTFRTRSTNEESIIRSQFLEYDYFVEKSKNKSDHEKELHEKAGSKTRKKTQSK